MSVSWIGRFEGTASFPTANRGLVGALERQGIAVRRALHNNGAGLTARAIAFEYPPRPLSVRHARQSCLSIWEFAGGARAVPETFKAVFREFDEVIVPNEFVAEQYRPATATPVRVVRYLGVDTAHYTPDGPRAVWGALFPGEPWVNEAEQVVLMIGGTDLRHGWDVALNVLKRLPSGVHLVAKWDTHYPVIQFHEVDARLHIYHDDLPDLAPLYRAADAFLLAARGVGFSLPAIEALACGCPVAAPPLPPLRDFATARVVFGEGGHYEVMGIHHVHDDCLPLWWEPDVAGLAAALKTALALPTGIAPDAAWRDRWSWDGVAREFAQEMELR